MTNIINIIIYWTGFVVWFLIISLSFLALNRRFKAKLATIWGNTLAVIYFINDLIKIVFYGAVVAVIGFCGLLLVNYLFRYRWWYG